ncbi:MAG TPA: hypothetical protein VLL97_08580 [Acidobacteriota bacterium]|nr:hypothetical protein [Acidobacteriota bacterium]
MNRYNKTQFWAVCALAAVFFCSTALLDTSAASYAEDKSLSEEETDYTEEEYNAWAKADQETYPLRRGELLLEFIKQYPKSTLMPHIEASYATLLFEIFEAGQYAELEILAEKWLERNPKDMQLLAYLAQATEKLGKLEECIGYLQRIFELEPKGAIALQIARMAHKLGKTDMYLQWAGKLLKHPEFENDVPLRFELMQFYISKNDMAKATEYAREVIRAAGTISKPDAKTEKFMRVALRQSHNVIGVSYFNQENFREAIKAFQQAISAERYGEGFFWIGMSQWELREVDDAMVSLAKAELLGGDIGVRAKDRLEQLYRGMHNQTLVGIDKIYRKAREELGMS